MRRLIILALLVASCSGGFRTKAECRDVCRGAHESCRKIDGEWACILAADEVAGSNGREDE